MAAGCIVLPGDDAPERVVFECLKSHGWPDIASRIGRGAAETIDALNAAIALANHHDWVKSCGDRLTLGGNILWHVMASSWPIIAQLPLNWRWLFSSLAMH
jgi:hypothetical protein